MGVEAFRASRDADPGADIILAVEAVRAQALTLAKGLDPTAANLDRIAKATTAEAARWAFTQWDLRQRARAKFERADRMLFDRDALEMATHERVAAYHAACFPKEAPVLDVGCGIGADLIGLARRGLAIGYELDPERAACARHNLEVHGVHAEVVVADGLEAEGHHVFADPQRRHGGRRHSNLADFSPDPRRLVERFADRSTLGIKLSPLLEDETFEDLAGGRPYRLEFVSFGRECREALLWLGNAVAPGRFAVHIESGGTLASSDLEDWTEEPLAWVHEADPAAIRAHCLGAFDHAALGDSNGYLTGGEAARSPWLRSYRVVWHGNADLKRTRAALDALDASVGEVKLRGVKVDPGELKRFLRRKSGRSVTLIVYPVGKRIRYVLVEPEPATIAS